MKYIFFIFLVLISFSSVGAIETTSEFFFPSFSFLLTVDLPVTMGIAPPPHYECADNNNPTWIGDHKFPIDGKLAVRHSSSANYPMALQLMDVTQGTSEYGDIITTISGCTSPNKMYSNFCLVQPSYRIEAYDLNPLHGYQWTGWTCKETPETISEWCLNADKSWCEAKYYPSGVSIPSTCYEDKSDCEANIIIPCTDTCVSLGYGCGKQLICDEYVECGNCNEGYSCVSGACIPDDSEMLGKCCYFSGTEVDVENAEKVISIVNSIKWLYNKFLTKFGMNPTEYVDLNVGNISKLEVTAGYHLISKDKNCGDYDAIEFDLEKCYQKSLYEIGDTDSEVQITYKTGEDDETDDLPEDLVDDIPFNCGKDDTDTIQIKRDTIWECDADYCKIKSYTQNYVSFEGTQIKKDKLPIIMEDSDVVKCHGALFGTIAMTTCIFTVDLYECADEEKKGFSETICSLGDWLNDSVNTGMEDCTAGWVILVVGGIIVLIIIMPKGGK